MGHYDNCRPGYCGKCGAAPGNIINGKCQFCFPKTKTKFKPVKPMTNPITPDEVVEQQDNSIPLQVIQVVNSLLKKKFRNGEAIIYQNEIVSSICTFMDIPRQKVFAEDYLDFEKVYEKAGWKVYYDKPGYNESYEAYFKFIKGNK